MSQFLLNSNPKLQAWFASAFAEDDFESPQESFFVSSDEEEEAKK